MLPGLKRFREIRQALRDAKDIPALRKELFLLKSRVDCEPGMFNALEAERESEAYALRYVRSDPLVSICIATYNRAALLCERAIHSLRQQSYRNIEIIVVGDHCTDDTEKRVAAINDTRVRFVNLPARGKYPQERERRWMVAGTVPTNIALTMAEGDFISHLDDDDAHAPDRVEKLLHTLQNEQLELVFHSFRAEQPDGTWKVNRAQAFTLGQVTTSSIMYDRFFARIPWDIDAHLLQEPGDWNQLRKIKFLGARIGPHPEVLLDHFREQSQIRLKSA